MTLFIETVKAVVNPYYLTSALEFDKVRNQFFNEFKIRRFVTMGSIHGHEVIEMMMGAGRSFTKETLEAFIIEKFGAQARFHTCSAEDLTSKGLVEFLDERQKFMESDDGEGFNMDPTKVCNHE